MARVQCAVTATDETPRLARGQCLTVQLAGATQTLGALAAELLGLVQGQEPFLLPADLYNK